MNRDHDELSILDVDVPGQTLSLSVQDINGVELDAVTIVHTNQPPVADIGSSMWVKLGDSACLDSSDSYDPDGDIDYWRCELWIYGEWPPYGYIPGPTSSKRVNPSSSRLCSSSTQRTVDTAWRMHSCRASSPEAIRFPVTLAYTAFRIRRT